jgi:ABC-type transport system involved in multi-copper enzyme maturation permease subunit
MATHRERVIAGGAALAVAVAFAMFSGAVPARAGSLMFEVLSWGAFVFCIFQGIGAAADALARERREGTLGLLFLTDLQASDILFGKFAAVAVRSFSIVLSFLPVFAMPLLLGGVTAGESWRIMSALLLTTFFAVSAGLLVSAMTASGLAAYGLTLGLVVLVILLPCSLVWILTGSLAEVPGFVWMTGPLGLMFEARDAQFNADPLPFWGALLYTIGVSVGILAGATVALDKFVHLQPRLGSSRFRKARLNPIFPRRQIGRENPAQWLARRTCPTLMLLWGIILVGSAVCFLLGAFGSGLSLKVIMGVQIFLGVLLKLWLAALAPQAINSARQSGALELLLCTPIKPRKIVRGQIDALIAYFLPPALALGAGLPLATILGGAVGDNAELTAATKMIVPIGLFWFLFFLIDAFALAYAGLWFGLSTHRVEGAVTKTAFAVLFLPWLTVVLPVIGKLGLFLWPVFWIYWASQRLKRDFRLQVAEQYSREKRLNLAPP